MDEEKYEGAQAEATEAIKQLDELIGEAHYILEKHENLKKRIDQAVGPLKLEEYYGLQKSKWLMLRLKEIKTIHLSLSEQYESLEIEELISLFHKLYTNCTELFTFKACEFDVYANNVLVHWKTKLTTRLSEEFTKEYFTKVKWPKVPINKVPSSRGSPAAPFQSILEKFKLYIKILIILSSADTLKDKVPKSKRICYPMRLMLEPVVDRCIYHFMISPKTNVLDKPEWYMNLAIKWIDENSSFIQEVIDPIVGEYPQYPGAYLQFVMGMIELVGMRLREDLEKITKVQANIQDQAACDRSNKIFILIYGELMIFTKEIRSLIGDEEYFQLDHCYDLLGMLLEHKDCMTKILNEERSRAYELMESIVSSDTCWKTLLGEEFQDQYKITECADRFMLMIQSISERLECFRDINSQHRLIELQCDLLEKFLEDLKSNRIRPRSTQFVNEFLTLNLGTMGIEAVKKQLPYPYFYILNNINFLHLVLQDQPSFLAPHVLGDLDKNPGLVKALKNISSKYKHEYDTMITIAIDVYDQSECDLSSYLEYIRPQIAGNLYEHIEDEAKKIYQEKRTRELF